MTTRHLSRLIIGISIRDVTPPSAPANVHVYDSIAPCELYLGWTQASDETDSQDKIEYEIY
ncbi:MAG: hypothetical protein V7638_5098 [Acidobacteriota bacterium]|jgi:hypothetical protein